MLFQVQTNIDSMSTAVQDTVPTVVADTIPEVVMENSIQVFELAKSGG